MVQYIKKNFMQDKEPRNAQGQQHGIWEIYYDNGKLLYKGTYINGLRHGLWIWYYTNGKLSYKGNYIQGKLDGLVEWYNLDGTINEITFYAR
jgi:antitoxin component YwqK of YwqJK toxin-antitoxin module